MGVDFDLGGRERQSKDSCFVFYSAFCCIRVGQMDISDCEQERDRKSNESVLLLFLYHGNARDVNDAC